MIFSNLLVIHIFQLSTFCEELLVLDSMLQSIP